VVAGGIFDIEGPQWHPPATRNVMIRTRAEYFSDLERDILIYAS